MATVDPSVWRAEAGAALGLIDQVPELSREVKETPLWEEVIKIALPPRRGSS